MDLTYLPITADVETVTVLKKAIAAHRAHAELKGLNVSIPNGKILIEKLALREARETSLNGPSSTLPAWFITVRQRHMRGSGKLQANFHLHFFTQLQLKFTWLCGRIPFTTALKKRPIIRRFLFLVY